MRYLLSLILILSAVTAHADDTRRFILMGEADEAIADGRWADADSLLSVALDIAPGDPSNVLLMSNLGIVRYNLGQDSLALATLDRAASIAPSSVTVISNRARVKTGMGDFSGAAADYRHIIDLDSTLVAPHFYLAVMALAVGDTAQARIHSLRVQELEPEGFESSFLMARLLSAEGRNAEALPYYNTVIRLDPQPEYYAARALCYLHIEDLSMAADDIASGLALDPQNGDLYLYRAILNKMRYRPDDSRADADRAIALGVPRALVDATLGR